MLVSVDDLKVRVQRLGQLVCYLRGIVGDALVEHDDVAVRDNGSRVQRGGVRDELFSFRGLPWVGLCGLCQYYPGTGEQRRRHYRKEQAKAAYHRNPLSIRSKLNGGSVEPPHYYFPVSERSYFRFARFSDF